MKPEKAIKAEIVRLGKVVKFRDLGELAQLAMIQYMAVDGDAWPWGPELSAYVRNDSGDYVGEWNKAMKADIAWYVERFGDRKFGLSEIEMTRCKEWVMMSEELKTEFKDFDRYHQWYLGHEDTPEHETVRPCILNSAKDFITWGLFQDGWHRFHRYVEMGLDKVPILYYV